MPAFVCPDAPSRRSRGAGRRLTGAVLALAGLAAVAAPAGAAEAPPTPVAGTTPVLWVGNNWDGTATAIDSSGSFTKHGTINVIPDKDARMAEIVFTPGRLIVYWAIQNQVLGHDQYVDDMYTTTDGQNLVVSRPSFGDVVSINIKTDKINWRFPVAGWRSDHMAVSPDGQRVAVSASLAKTVHVLDMNTGKQLGSFPTGDQPHENRFTADGKYIYNESIGNVTISDPNMDALKGTRRFTIADATTYQVIKNVDMGQKLAEYGRPDVSQAMRPFTLSPDEKTMYFQSSYFHGYSVYDLVSEKVTNVVDLPTTEATPADKKDYIINSAHHGIAMDRAGKNLCVAGTVSDYATVVDASTGKPGPLIRGHKPYWITLAGDTEHCVVSWSGDNAIGIIDISTGQLVRNIPVGWHPQRSRLGLAPSDWVAATTS